MTRREHRTVELALAILRRAARTHIGKHCQTEAVQLALRVLLPYVDRHPLTTFWIVAGAENALQRSHNLRRLLELIEAGALRRMAG